MGTTGSMHDVRPKRSPLLEVCESNVKADAAKSVKNEGREYLRDVAKFYPFDLGVYGRQGLGERDSGTALWFYRGLNWMFALHFEEAVRCFERSVQREPDFFYALWGLSYCFVPHSYFEVNEFSKNGLSDTQLALEYINKAIDICPSTNIAALKLLKNHKIRCVWPPSLLEDNSLIRYSEVMREMYREYPNDADITYLFLDALVQLKPWELFDTQTGEATNQANEICTILESALKMFPKHPGLCRISVVVFASAPIDKRSSAMAQADILRNGIIPDGGFLIHIASHLDFQLGNYARAVRTNQHAIACYRKCWSFAQLSGVRYSSFVVQMASVHLMLVSSASLGSFKGETLSAAEGLVDFCDNAIHGDESLKEKLDLYLGTQLLTWVRFSMWSTILEQPAREENDGLAGCRGIFHYARAVAFAATGKLEEAQEEKSIFEQCKRMVCVLERGIGNTSGKALYGVLAARMDGEIAYRKGDLDEAFALFDLAVKLQDGLKHHIPAALFPPVRHRYGMLLIEQLQFREAENIFREDLVRYPSNPFALSALATCLKMLGRSSESEFVEIEFEQVLSDALIKLYLASS